VDNKQNQLPPRATTSRCRLADGRCDKLTVDRRKYCQLISTDDDPYYRTNLHHAELTTLCDDLRAVAKFYMSRVWGEVSETSTLSFYTHELF